MQRGLDLVQRLGLAHQPPHLVRLPTCRRLPDDDAGLLPQVFGPAATRDENAWSDDFSRRAPWGD